MQSDSYFISSFSRSLNWLFFALSVVLFSLFFSLPLSAGELLCGIDRLEASGFRELSGMKVGLITNVAGISRKGEPDYLIMLRNGVTLQFLMAPEHGFSADIAAGQKVASTVIADSIPVFSLYGASKKPDIYQLKRIDILLFDLQDTGVRCYTYISTMKMAMEACQEAGIPFMVLDRPNPIMPLHPDGFMLAPGYESFVGAVDIPFIHAMTVGEIALLLRERLYKTLDLRLIPMEGYQRDRFGDEYPGFSFRSPSPNIRGVETAILYPATVFLEATTVSEGRGTDDPFMQFGSPFVNSRKLAEALEPFNIPGVRFEIVSFKPRSGKFSGEWCQGLKLVVTDRKTFAPFRTATAILLALQRLYPDKLGLEKKVVFFDQLAGTPLYREMIIKQMPLEAIMDASRQQIEQFSSSIPATLLYN